MELQAIQKDVHNRLLSLRAIDRLLHSEQCADAFKHASAAEKAKLLIADISPSFLKEWIRLNTKSDLELLSYRELRERGKNHNIFRWSRLTKEELVEALSAIFV